VATAAAVMVVVVVVAAAAAAVVVVVVVHWPPSRQPHSSQKMNPFRTRCRTKNLKATGGVMLCLVSLVT
jgi:hypothetical protein